MFLIECHAGWMLQLRVCWSKHTACDRLTRSAGASPIDFMVVQMFSTWHEVLYYRVWVCTNTGHHKSNVSSWPSPITQCCFEMFWGIHELWATKCTSSMNLSPLHPHSYLGILILCDLSGQARTFLGMNPRVAQNLRWTSCEVASVYVTPPVSRRCTMPLQRPNVATRCHWRTETPTCHRETTMIRQVFIFRT